MEENSPQLARTLTRQLTVTEPHPPRGPRSSFPRPRRSMTVPPDIDPRSMPADVPNPSHRHGTPSGPWPWLDLHVSIDPREIIEPNVGSIQCSHRRHEGDEHCWCKYPQSLYPNWTYIQQKASRIWEAKGRQQGWRIYPLVISKDGLFHSFEHKSGRRSEVDGFWSEFRLPEERAKDAHVHALFVDNMPGPIMQMLGTKYNIEPFFFSSSFGWIPSRYQENPIPKKSDHITITLTFIHCIDDPYNESKSEGGDSDDESSVDTGVSSEDPAQRNIAIKTNEYLWLKSCGKILFSDIMSLHMIRDRSQGHTIISYHAPRRFRSTPAKKLRDRFHLTGSSVYWSKIFERSRDPTFTFLSLLWYPLYAWDESLEALYNHICSLESNVLENTNLDFTQELHRIRAHLLHYTDLLADFRKTVEFVQETQYPALDDEECFTPEERKESVDLMEKECKNLLNEIARLDMARKMQDKRLTNVMQLGFSTVNIMDSRRMHALTEATVRDSAAMKQIAYLTMVFLPASFVATAFGMNVTEINEGSVPSLGHYFAAAFPLTAVTIWIIVALQIEMEDPGSTRRRRRTPPQQKPKAEELQAPLPNATSAPPGHGLRQAYTSPEGEIIVTSPEHEYHEHNDTDYEKYTKQTDPDHFDHAHNNFYDAGYHKPQTISIWKRLLWPIILTQKYYLDWQEARDRKTIPRPNQKKVSDANNQEKRNIHLSLPFFSTPHKTRNGTMTPAAQFAADVRSHHSGSNGSLEQTGRAVRVPTSPRLPPILKHGDSGPATQNSHSGGELSIL
ncbi:hypothetical protein NP233_g148 [Leucocoprinus birnbaumii]|uniref:Uncharacterized protein n=1 Tax=Leucocoprinus birnbaumii TaxID=56174 RepID=A0AAD5W4K7_9AGAR|nr:hypothetical protein NP233_g148 [Leucocoprinus birnbaumii]